MATLNPANLPASWAATPEARERQRSQLAQGQLDDNTTSDLFDAIAAKGKAEEGHTAGKNDRRKTAGAAADVGGAGALSRKYAAGLEDATQTDRPPSGGAGALSPRKKNPGDDQAPPPASADPAAALSDTLAAASPADGSPGAVGLGDGGRDPANVQLRVRPNDILP